jgi:hypothetical protein
MLIVIHLLNMQLASFTAEITPACFADWYGAKIIDGSLASFASGGLSMPGVRIIFNVPAGNLKESLLY